MDELFDTTGMRQTEALRRHAADAQEAGQGDLFDMPVEPMTATVTAMAAVVRQAVDEQVFTWPTPVGALLARDDVAGEMMLA